MVTLCIVCNIMGSNSPGTQLLHRILNICNVLLNLLHPPQHNLSICLSRLLRNLQVKQKTCDLRLKTLQGSNTRLCNQRIPGTSLLTF